MTGTTVDGFVPDPINQEHTITTPGDFSDFVVQDEVLIVRNEKPIALGKVEDLVTRQSTGQTQLVLSGINRRTVRPTDFLRSLKNSPERYANDENATTVTTYTTGLSRQ